MKWLYLMIAIATEVVATTALKSSDGFTRLWPSVIVVIGYGFSFYFFALTLRTIPTGVAYAIWSGVGMILIALLGLVIHHQKLDMPAVPAWPQHAGVAVIQPVPKRRGIVGEEHGID
jgi:multidrug transporter EmrE-like cation transporter